MNSLLGVMRLNYLNKIFVLQKWRLHLIYFVDRKDHAIPLLVDAKILPITFLYYENIFQNILQISMYICLLRS